jgi:hypothetical protein
VDETENVSSTICCKDRDSCEIESTQFVSVSALLGLSHCINRESFLATSAFPSTDVPALLDDDIDYLSNGRTMTTTSIAPCFLVRSFCNTVGFLQ